METTLYSQFLCVLNEKKKKIKELKHKLDPSELQVNDSGNLGTFAPKGNVYLLYTN